MTSETNETNERPYRCMYKGKQVTVYATTSFAAQTKAVALLKPKKRYDISVLPLGRDIDGAEL